MTQLFLVRHGESTWNEVGRYQGRIDTELSELGQRQATAVARHLKGVPFKAIFASPLRRALVTAIYIATEQGLDVQIEGDLTEIDHGQWNGLLREEVEKRYGPLLQLWQYEPSKADMPGGENISQVNERAWRVVNRIVANYPNDRVLVCTHDAVLRAIICKVLGMSLDQIWSVQTENASITTIEFENQECRLLQLNDTCHLAALRSNIAGQAL